MDILGDDYDESNLENYSNEASSTQPKLTPKATLDLAVNPAPDVHVFESKLVSYHNPADKIIYTNPKADALYRPLQGPTVPNQFDGLEGQYKNHMTGYVEKSHMNHFAFDVEYHTFHSYGHALDPSERGIQKRVLVNDSVEKLGDGVEGDALWNLEVHEKIPKSVRKRIRKEAEKSAADWTARKQALDAKLKADEELAAAQTVESEEDRLAREAEEQKKKDEAKALAATAEFHAKKRKDYQGRTWVDLPAAFKEREENTISYIPKLWVHSYVGHTMGVQAIRFFPQSGHLLLSAGMDARIKIWDVYNQRKCIQTYTAHNLAVRDVQWAEKGKKFYSASFDQDIKLWDTETGKVISTVTNGKTPYCVTVHPDADKQDIVIVGCQNKKAVQYDFKSGAVVQEYDEHLGAVNTVTFVEEGKKIVTTSDDKKLFVWEYGIPVVVKHIAEPFMHSMPSVAVHPCKKYIACQSMDNQIIIYEAYGRFRFQGSRRFKGHVCSGYACQVNFSPCGTYVMSGDADGKIWFWNWKSLKNYRTMKAHDGVCIGCDWHPTQTSKVATCGWDGVIKLWD
eukprot:Platyproteum_vivax@DN7159_c0_g1_i1.p2